MIDILNTYFNPQHYHQHIFIENFLQLLSLIKLYFLTNFFMLHTLKYFLVYRKFTCNLKYSIFRLMVKTDIY